MGSIKIVDFNLGRRQSWPEFQLGPAEAKMEQKVLVVIIRMGSVGPMVSVLSFYSGDTSSSPTEALFVFCSIFGKNKNIKKSRWLAHLKKNILFLFNSFFSSVRNHFDYIEFLFLIACCKSRDYF